MDIRRQEDHPFMASSALVTEICVPLFKKFDIRCFSHFRLNKKRQYTGVISDSDWANIYLQYELQNDDMISFNPEQCQQQCIVWSEEQLHPSINKVKILADAHNLGQGITLTFCNGDVYDFYGFAAETDNMAINAKLTANSALLVRFILYYLSQIKKNKRLQGNYASWCELKNVKPDNESYITSSCENLKGVNKEFWHKRYYFNVAGHDIHFTDTQMTCLALLFERKTAKQIAQYLGLSFRTIQEHITAMRNKVGAQSSNDLYTILSKNDYVQLYCRLYRRHYEKRGVLWNY